MVILTNFAPPEQGIRHKEENIQAHIRNESLGTGTLFIAESRLSWIGAASGQGFSLEYPAIALHAVSRDTTAFPSECLYLMLDGNIDDTQASHSDGSDESNDNPSEVRFIPDDKSQLDNMYAAMSECQLLHPDPDQSDDGEDEGYHQLHGDTGDFYTTEEEIENLNPQGLATLARLENMLAHGAAGGDLAGVPEDEAEMSGDDEPQVGGGATINGAAPGDEPMDDGQFDDAA